MIKCFLSHSSKDKESYVRLVADKLRPETKIYDEETFEAGMSPSEEIINGLDITSLFIIFISEHALKSEWVKKELLIAKANIDAGKLKRIYPIIIDEKIDYNDPRIPLWMRKNLNIQHIRQPKVAARKINSRLRELAWLNHPTLKEREKIFVGRNDKIKNVEERFDDFSRSTPTVFVASGLTSIGRKSFIKNSLRKASVIRESYEMPQISLDSSDSVEDFILKLDDLGFTENKDLSGLLRISVNEKISMAIELCKTIINEKERLLIEDMGSIISRDGIFIDWFQEIVASVSDNQHLTFCIASKFRPKNKISYQNDSYYIEEIPELEKSERDGLLVRYSKFKNMDISKEDMGFFSRLLTGYPEQVIYTVDSIAESSVFEVRKNSHLIQEYASDKAKLIVDGLKSDTEALDFLYFLSKFEFISFEFLFDVVDEKTYFPTLSHFIQSSICERLGSTGDYLRVNEVIKDFIARNNFGIPTVFSEKLKQHVSDFIESYSNDGRDLSDYIFSIKEALLSGHEIPDRLLIPSYFLKTIKALYDKGGSVNYREAIKLSDRVLLNEDYLHSSIVENVYFLKCQALARLRDYDFFGVVKKIQEPDCSFLHGFFYRIAGEQEKSISSYKRVLDRKPNDFRAKSELILVYMQSDEHDLAYSLAKELYKKKPNNPLNVNNYLSCLFHKDKQDVDRAVIEEAISKLQNNSSDRAQEMYSSARAKVLAKFDNKINEAYEILEDSIKTYPNVTYPMLSLADLAIQNRNLDKLKTVIEKLDKIESKNTQTYRTYIRSKAIYLSMSGEYGDAVELASKELKGVRKEAMDNFYSKLNSVRKKS